MLARHFRTDAELVPAFLAEREVFCPECQYNLRGLPTSRCPECGLDLALSIGAAGHSTSTRWPLWFRRASNPVALLATLSLGLGLAHGPRAAAMPILLWTVVLCIPHFARWLRGYACNPFLPMLERRRRFYWSVLIVIGFISIWGGVLAVAILPLESAP